jgi:hypothetical protein
MIGSFTRTGWARVVAVLGVMAALGAVAAPTVAAAPAAPAVRRVGRISTAAGGVTIAGERGAREAGIAESIFNNETVTTAATAAATVLLDSKVLIKLDGSSAVRIVEREGRTEFQLERGAVEVFAGKRPPGVEVAMVDTESIIITTTTVFFAQYVPATRTGTYACEEHAIKLTTRGDGKTTVVQAGKLARVRAGALQAVENADRDAVRKLLPNVRPLAARAAQRSGSLSQQRAAAATLRGAFIESYAGHGLTRQQSERLADLLLARCTQLDRTLEIAETSPGSVPGLLRVASASDNVAHFFVNDPDVDGDVVRVTARSCTDATLFTADFKLAGGNFPVELTLDGTPNIVEFAVTALETGVDSFGNPDQFASVDILDQDKKVLGTVPSMSKGQTQVVQVPIRGPQQPAAQKARLRPATHLRDGGKNQTRPGPRALRLSGGRIRRSQRR